MRCLVIEDDAQLRAYIEKGLREAGHTVDTAGNGRDGLFLATTERYDAMVIDWMLPEVDGMRVLHALRAGDDNTPVLMLSARSQVDDRVRGLRSGANDYLVKPFAFEELLARLEILAARRAAPATEVTSLACHDLQMDLLSRRVTRGGRVLDLNPREFSSICCGTRSRWSPEPCCWKVSGTTISIPRPTSSTCTSAGCGRKSTVTSIVP